MMEHLLTLPELLARANALTKLTIGEIALQTHLPLPNHKNSKGWLGQLLETILGATSGNKPQPDFAHLGIELKTIPLTPQGKPLESTFICSASLTKTVGQTWEDSLVYQKLKHILWIPIITCDKSQALSERTLGKPLLWQPSTEQEYQLKIDWEEIMEMIALGQLAQITANHGTYLQLRPKGANAKALIKAIGEQGEPTKTLPRGFYLRAGFTRMIFSHIKDS